MCGIAGCVVAPGRRPDRAALCAMARALEPRGPDDEGIEVWENVGLVNRRLAIVDTSEAGHQPISDAGGRWTISFNGEVYNHLELRDELGARSWRGRSDSETLVAALAGWGEAALARCNGPIGLAALDRERRLLLLARDRFQKKPLYVARHAGAVWFASEVRALLAAGVPARCDRDALLHSAVRGWLNGPLTPFGGIERLAGGTLREIDLETHAQRDRTWFDPTEQLDPGYARELAALPAEELTRAFDRTLAAAVERRLMSDVPLGTMLSGGLDSALVTALAREAGADVTAFTASVPSQPRVDEIRHARRASDALGVRLETATVEPGHWPRLLVRAVWLHEYPLLNPGIALIEPIAALARERGVKVLLTGEAADELLAGYDHLHPWEMVRFLSPREAALRAAGAVRRYGDSGAKVLARWRGVRFASPPPFPREPRAERGRRELVARAKDARGAGEGTRARLEAELLADLYYSHFGHLLNRMDKNAMGASVETRVPFLDPELTRLVLNLPLERRVGRHPKPILREVAGTHLPPEIACRQKQMSMHYDLAGVFAALDPAALADGALREALGLAPGDWAEVLTPRSAVAPIWLWSAEIWARLFLRGESAEQVEGALFGERSRPRAVAARAA